MKNMLVIILLLSTSLTPAASSTDLDDYIVLNAKINNQPVLLALDTGAERVFLFSRTAKRLGLEVTDPPKVGQPSPGKFPVKLSEECILSIEGAQGLIKSRLPVFDLPAEAAHTSLDGIVGWQVIKSAVMWINADVKRLLILDKLPRDISMWSKWAIHDDPGYSVLLFKPFDSSDENGVILIDTGSPKGVGLNAGLWKDWISRHPESPYTLSAYYTPAVGLKVYPEYWADELILGDLTMSNVPIQEQDQIFEQAIKGLMANIGLFALTRMEVIIDGPAGYVYTRPVKNPVSKYPHNRAGAVFVPDIPRTTQLEAHVVDNGPAFRAGIRSGDVLLKIDDLDVTQWQTDPNVLPLTRFWERPAETRLLLTLKRDDEPFKATVELEDIFP